MTQSSSHEDLLNKWAPILNSVGVGMMGSKSDWLSQYCEAQSYFGGPTNSDSLTIEKQEEFQTILPISRQVFAQTIGLNLVTVKPMCRNSDEELERIEKEVKSENRDRKIDAITEDKKYNEMKIEEHTEFEKGPSGQLFYMDYSYNSVNGGTQSNPKKSKKKNGKI